ncbi:hypothetical protein Lser_V15G22903 [Lactuca serriola]
MELLYKSRPPCFAVCVALSSSDTLGLRFPSLRIS